MPAPLDVWALVVLNPVETDRLVNMASSSYRILDVCGAVEGQLRAALNTPSARVGGSWPIWGTVWMHDPGISAYRMFLSHMLSTDPAQRGKRAPEPNPQQNNGDEASEVGSDESPVTTPQKKRKPTLLVLLRRSSQSTYKVKKFMMMSEFSFSS